MTVKQLVEALQHAKPEALVWLDHDHTHWGLMAIDIDDDEVVLG